MALGLEAAHSVGLIHRDIKPSNILLDLATGRAKIMDFGLWRSVDAAGLTLEGELLGTPAYMSPEQIRQPDAIDVRSDVYSLGATLYEALTGTEPFRGTTHGVLLQVLHEEPRRPRLLNEAVPLDLETICLHALAKEPARRYGSAAAMADDLRRWLRSEPIQARPIGAAERSWRSQTQSARCSSQQPGRLASRFGKRRLDLVRKPTRKRKKRDRGRSGGGRIQCQFRTQGRSRGCRQCRRGTRSWRGGSRRPQRPHIQGAGATRQQGGHFAPSEATFGNRAGGLAKDRHAAHGPDSERSVQAAYDRMSDVFSSLGRTEEAKKSSATACNLAEKPAAHLPDDTQAQSDLALAHDKLGSFSYVEHNLVEALAQVRKSPGHS